jgi:hypothetical protein
MWKFIPYPSQPLSNDVIVFNDCLVPALILCAAAIETFGHVTSPLGSTSRELFYTALGRFLEFLRQDCCFARDDVQRLLQVELQALCPNLSSHFALVAQLEASAGIMTFQYLFDNHDNFHDLQQHIVMPPPDACPWALVSICTKSSSTAPTSQPLSRKKSVCTSVI